MTSAPATMAIGRSRIEALAASVSRACTCFACSGTADAHSAADDAAPAALSTARCAVPVKRSTWDAALSAIRSVAWCAACATSSTLAPAGLAPLPLPVRLLPKGVVRSMLVPFEKDTRQKCHKRCGGRVCGRTMGLLPRPHHQTQSDFIVGRLSAGATDQRLSVLLGRSLTRMYCRPASLTSSVPREFFSPNPAAARVPTTESGITPRGEPNAALTNHSSSAAVNCNSRGIAPAI